MVIWVLQAQSLPNMLLRILLLFVFLLKRTEKTKRKLETWKKKGGGGTKAKDRGINKTEKGKE